MNRPDDGSVEMKYVALNVILKIKGLLCLTEICNLYELKNTSELLTLNTYTFVFCNTFPSVRLLRLMMVSKFDRNM